MKKTTVVALTGGIGSGKSTILNWLKERGVPTLSSDEIAREVVAPGMPALQKIAQYFGEEILNADGTLNRAKLRRLVFQQTEHKTWLEHLLHPIIRQQTEQKLKMLKSPPPSLIVIEIPLLVETGLPPYIDEVWVADCSVATQIQRASQRDQCPADEVEALIKRQASREERLKVANVVINTERPKALLKESLIRLLEFERDVKRAEANRA